MWFVKQLIIEFVKKENIHFEGACPAEVLLGRDTRPSGGSLLEAAKQVLLPPDCWIAVNFVSYVIWFFL